MKYSSLKTYSLFLAVTIWGTLLGGIVYSNSILMPVFLAALPDSVAAVNGPYGMNEMPFWMFIHPILVSSLILTLILNWRIKSRRLLILTTLGIYVLVLIATTFFFVPELMAFQNSATSNIPPAEWLVRGNRWRMMSWIRGGVMYAAFLPLLFALTKTTDIGKES